MDMALARSPVGRMLDGRYRVESLIARGGMATVYLGTDTRLDRTVALKIMHAELANDEDFVRRFVGEARSVARLSHPNVVGVYDQGADGRTLYLAMEHVPGQTLRDLLNERGRLAPHEALDIMSGVLAGLAAAHQAGLAHRDVKPENVLLTSAHSVKVADFGLARMLSGVSHTKTGMIIGTAAYLAPEQVARGVADARTDVYASGIMLFELLTGVQPHRGESPLAVAHMHVNQVMPTPSRVAPGLPPALDALVALATSRDPDLRPSDAGQFLRAVTEVRRGLPVASLPAAGQAPIGLPSAGVPYAGPASPGLPAAGVPGAALPTAGMPLTGTPPAGPPGAGMRGADMLGGGWPGGGMPTTAMPGAHDDGFAGHHSAAPTPRSDLDFPPASWPTQGSRSGHYGQDVVPGLAVPAGRSPATSQFADPHRLANHTLVVAPPGSVTQVGRRRRGYSGPREPGLQRWLFSRKLVYLVAGLMAVILIGVLIWWQTAGQYTTVAQVGGLAAATARLELRNEGLTVKNGKRQFDNRVAKGNVISTRPAIGTRVSKGGTVTLIVSRGPHLIAVPQVTGVALAAAQAALKHAGLIPGQVKNEPSATIQDGIVIATNPASGVSWPQTRPVALVVSAGPPLPNFVGQQKAVAEQWTQANGVSLNEVGVDSTQPAGTITNQSPAPGGAFTHSEVVTVDVSNGPQMVAVPNVDGMNVDDATQTLKQAGFQVNVIRTGPLDNVFTYNPNGQAPQGSNITIWVGLP